jgi:hypothetical protein
MTAADLTSQKIGEKVYFIDEMYDKDLKMYVPLKYTGVIDSLLIDVNFGSYGYLVKLSKNHLVNFILKNDNTKNLTGIDLNELNN